MKRLIYISIIFPLLFACGKQNDKLETALRLAGDNRPELEKVLTHYSQSSADSLKLRAARFLIENMPGHYTITGKKVEVLRSKIDNDTTASYFLKKALDIAICYLEETTYGAHKQEDIHCIKADFLIHHIDRSFEKREKYPWAQELPFDFFLEHILPYRFIHERIDCWIDSLRISPAVWTEIVEADDQKYSLWNANLRYSILGDDFPIYHPLIMDILHHEFPYQCRDISLIAMMQSRAMAIPASIDYFPNYANRNGYHYWHNKLSPEFRNTQLASALERRSSKVYRNTYSIQPCAIVPKGEYVPEFFLNPFVKDVTDEYFYTANIQIPSLVTPHKKPHYAYLYTFCNLTWLPSAIGSYSPTQTSFQKMTKNIVYLPGYYHARSIKAINYPFILQTDGRTTYLKPDTTKLLYARLERKYPSPKILSNRNRRLASTHINASNDINHKCISLSTCKLFTRKSHTDILTNTIQNYRYWQVVVPQMAECAEIIFFDTTGKEIHGKIDKLFEKLYDSDPLTSQVTDFQKHAQITIDFGHPVAVSRIMLLPRSDGNGIYPGDDYELFYHDLDGWRSLGRYVATDYFLDYDNLPANALYWLHNHSRGVEERPFTITPSGDIRFW